MDTGNGRRPAKLPGMDAEDWQDEVKDLRSEEEIDAWLEKQKRSMASQQRRLEAEASLDEEEWRRDAKRAAGAYTISYRDGRKSTATADLTAKSSVFVFLSGASKLPKSAVLYNTPGGMAVWVDAVSQDDELSSHRVTITGECSCGEVGCVHRKLVDASVYLGFDPYGEPLLDDISRAIGASVPAACFPAGEYGGRRYGYFDLTGSPLPGEWFPGGRVPITVSFAGDIDNYAMVTFLNESFSSDKVIAEPEVHWVAPDGSCVCEEDCLQSHLVRIAQSKGIQLFDPLPLEGADSPYRTVQTAGSRILALEDPNFAALGTPLPAVIEVQQTATGGAAALILPDFDEPSRPWVTVLSPGGACGCGDENCWHRRLLKFSDFDPLYPRPVESRGDVAEEETSRTMTFHNFGDQRITVEKTEPGRVRVIDEYDQETYEFGPEDDCPCGYPGCVHKGMVDYFIRCDGWDVWAE